MKNILKLAVILACFGIVAAASLGSIYKITKPVIEYQMEKARQEALSLVLPDASKIIEIEADGEDSYFAGFAGEDTTAAPDYYAFIAKGQGYSSVIQTMVGIDNKGNILGLKILFQQETPGLGAKAEGDPFLDGFKGGKSAFGLAVDKDGGEITSITAATITSRAIANSIAQKVVWLNNMAKFK